VATKAERDARLNALKAAVTAWADKRTKYLNDQVTFSKRVLRGRTGSEKLTSTTVTLGKDLTVDAINTFLTG
jgi:hypothetical protein